MWRSRVGLSDLRGGGSRGLLLRLRLRRQGRRGLLLRSFRRGLGLLRRLGLGLLSSRGILEGLLL